MAALWFWIVAVMLAAYVVLDGFDLGVGILFPFVARTEDERQQAIRYSMLRPSAASICRL
jgi:cytochrome d ubiquinol oxidase subunit II